MPRRPTGRRSPAVAASSSPSAAASAPHLLSSPLPREGREGIERQGPDPRRHRRAAVDLILEVGHGGRSDPARQQLQVGDARNPRMATEPQEGGRRCKRPGRRHGSSRKRTHQGRAGLHLQGTPPWKQQQGSFLRYSSRKRTGGCILKATYYQFDIRYSSSSNLIDAGAPPWEGLPSLVLFDLIAPLALDA